MCFPNSATSVCQRAKLYASLVKIHQSCWRPDCFNCGATIPSIWFFGDPLPDARAIQVQDIPSVEYNLPAQGSPSEREKEIVVLLSQEKRAFEFMICLYARIKEFTMPFRIRYEAVDKFWDHLRSEAGKQHEKMPKKERKKENENKKKYMTKTNTKHNESPKKRGKAK